jgi:septal ring factor EnvC (AmiA/AmiB activator)
MERPMTDLALSEINRRIEILRDNLRQLTEQATAFSGAADEERTSDRIAEQQDELDRLLEERKFLEARR